MRLWLACFVDTLDNLFDFPFAKAPSMNVRPLVLALLATALLAACQKHTPAQPEPAAKPSAEAEMANTMPQRPPAPTVAHGNEYDVSIGTPDTQQALQVPAGGKVAGQVTVPMAGRLVGISVQVGNYFNSSTGSFDVEACVADRCTRGTADAGLSVDNDNFDLGLAEPLNLAAGDVLTYTFARPAGANDLVIWTFAAGHAGDHLVDDAARTPKVRLLLQ